MKESTFQRQLIFEIKERLPGSIVLKNDPNYIQGVPDLTILYKEHWAALEVKRNKHARRRPNQKYYIDILNNMSFAKIVYPENKEDILNELQQALQS